MDGGFAIAAGHRLTAETGAEILREGGNAVEAVIGAAFTSFIAEPVMAQPFGGGFLMIHNQDGQIGVLDFFGHTPKKAPPKADLDNRAIEADFGSTKQIFHIGAGTIAVPGIAAGFERALSLYSHMPLAELASQAIAHAQKGVAIDATQASIFQVVRSVLTCNGEMKQLYSGAHQSLLQKGDIWRNPNLASCLEEWARDGARFMIEGEAAQELLEATALCGAVRADDLRDYQPIWRQALPYQWQNAKTTLWTNPPPSAGGSLLVFILSLLEDEREPFDPLALAFSLRLAHQARAQIGHDKNPAIGELLLSKDIVADFKSRPKAYHGTTHISAIDRNGLGAALTLTNGAGSGLLAKKSGIHFNDMLGEPDLVPSSDHAFPENLRLCSMMAPSVLKKDDAIYILGAAGSLRIPSALVQVILPLIQGKTPLEAVMSPRLYVENGLDFENFFNADIQQQLTQSFQPATLWDKRDMFFGGANIVMKHRAHFDGAGDPRRGGVMIKG